MPRPTARESLDPKGQPEGARCRRRIAQQGFGLSQLERWHIQAVCRRQMLPLRRGSRATLCKRQYRNRTPSSVSASIYRLLTSDKMSYLSSQPQSLQPVTVSSNSRLGRGCRRRDYRPRPPEDNLHQNHWHRRIPPPLPPPNPAFICTAGITARGTSIIPLQTPQPSPRCLSPDLSIPRCCLRPHTSQSAQASPTGPARDASRIHTNRRHARELSSGSVCPAKVGTVHMDDVAADLYARVVEHVLTLALGGTGLSRNKHQERSHNDVFVRPVEVRVAGVHGEPTYQELSDCKWMSNLWNTATRC